MEKIYEVVHSCGWGPYTKSFHRTESGARLEFVRFSKELRKKNNYIKGSWNRKDVERQLDPNVLERCFFMTESESNNESGHEFWENEEWLEIVERELKP